MASDAVIGRFAPTPSGPLHFGSLVTAVASYCHARSQQGQWLLRIEDVDTPRNVEGSVDRILFALEGFGLEWDGEIEYQSHHFDHYQQVLQTLLGQQLCYACECSRRTLRKANALSGPLGLVYPGTCRNSKLDSTNHSIRINTAGSGKARYIDQVYGNVELNIEKQSGDFVLKRADGIYAYHLAVVVDDERQGISQIVRGADLLEASCLHLFLQQLLGYRKPEYLHVPLIRNASGVKLAKQTGATAIDAEDKVSLLIDALQILGQVVDLKMQEASVSEILKFAIDTWQYAKITVPAGDIY